MTDKPEDNTVEAPVEAAPAPEAPAEGDKKEEEKPKPSKEPERQDLSLFEPAVYREGGGQRSLRLRPGWFTAPQTRSRWNCRRRYRS